MTQRRNYSRRTYLALAGATMAGLAGCQGDSGETNPTESGGETPTGETSTPGASTGDSRSGTATETPTVTATESADGTATDTPTADGTETETATETPTDGSGRPKAIERMESKLATVNFDGEYFDTHAHWLPAMGPNIPSNYAPMMNKYDIGATALFSPSVRAARNYQGFLKALTDPGVEYLPFMSAPPPGRRLGKELRALYAGNEKAFWGIGEWKPQKKPYPPVDGKRYTPLWKLSADLDIPVMFHPKASQEGTVEPALKAHPNTTFLLHGHQMMSYGQDREGLGPTLPRLLKEYDNLYWTADVTTLLAGAFLRFRSVSAFVDWYDNRSDPYIRNARAVVSKLMEAAPKKVMWGTDVARPWNTKDKAFSRMMEATERILKGVPEKHHAAYKRENALRLFDL